jgi:hypothetical protein
LPNGTVDWRGWPSCGRAGNRLRPTPSAGLLGGTSAPPCP